MYLESRGKGQIVELWVERNFVSQITFCILQMISVALEFLPLSLLQTEGNAFQQPNMIDR